MPAVTTAGALASRLRRSAFAYLSRFSAHRARLTAVLTRRAERYGPDLSADVRAHAVAAEVDRCVALGLIDDQAWADARARRLLARGKPLGLIRDDLIARGLPTEVADRAIGHVAGESAEDPDIAAARAFARRRRLGPYRRTPDVDRHKELAAFARAGFSYAVAKTLVDAEADDI